VRRSLAVSFLALSLIAAGCSSDSDGSTSESRSTTVAAETTTTAAAETTTTAAETTTTTDPGFVEATDVVYMTIGGAELLMDVYTPAGEGPWPVVVAMHGLDSDGKDGADTVEVAEAAVVEGMVVFAPSWIVWRPETPPVPVSLDGYQEWKSAVGCAVAFAQQNAADYGGDPDNTVIYGFSAGAGFALAVSMDSSGESIPGCDTDAAPEAVSGVVLGGGEYWLYSQNFDGAFEDDTAEMQAELATLIDPASWPADLDAEFFLWVAEGGTNPRSIDDPADLSGWFAPRDPDGSIERDLERLDQFEDGVVTNVDAGQLLELRLSEAGIDVTLDQYPDGHTPLDKVPELVGYLKAAAAQ
jgi:acetyl esterase/lipase